MWNAKMSDFPGRKQLLGAWMKGARGRSEVGREREKGRRRQGSCWTTLERNVCEEEFFFGFVGLTRVGKFRN